MTDQQKRFNILLPGYEMTLNNEEDGVCKILGGFVVSNTTTNSIMVEALLEHTKEIQGIVSGRHIQFDGPCSLPLAMAFTRIVGATAPSLKVNAPRENAYVLVFKTHD